MFNSIILNEQGRKELEVFKTEMSMNITHILSYMSESREKALFKTKIEEAVFWGSLAICSKPSNIESVKEYAECLI